MSEPQVTPPAPEPQARPVHPTPPPPPHVVHAPPPPHAARSSLVNLFLTFSVLFNCAALVILAIVCVGLLTVRSPFDLSSGANAPLNETVYSGKSSAHDKIAIIQINGVIMEGLLNYPHKQIEQAVEDDHVKAIVLRINSPGGSVTASDDLHHRLMNLRDGKTPGKHGAPKPIVVSMGSLAASGGYYIAMPGQTIVAERTTLTASIGVYSAFPNVNELGHKVGFSMTTIKQGEIKDSGSPFREMSDHEREVWQDMVNHAYLQFLQVVETGRKDRLQKPLLEEFDVKPAKGEENLKHPPSKGPYKRYLADGGIFTADKAKELGLIDEIGYLDDAINIAHKASGLGADYKVVKYEQAPSLIERLLDVQAKTPNTELLDPGKVKNGFVPRLWYLMPGCEVSGILAGMETPNE